MAAFSFTKAVKRDELLRMALMGPPGSGKTYTALRIATALGGPIALIDSERGSARKYAHLFDFFHGELTVFSPSDYVGAIRAVDAGKFRIAIVDSWSHAWSGKGGALEMVDEKAAASRTRNSFEAWRTVTPEHNKMVDAFLACQAHLIVTLRTKVEYVVEKDERTGKSTPRKVGMAPIQREGVEYEFDVVGEMDDAVMRITKTRCPDLERSYHKPGEDIVATLRPWLGMSGDERVEALKSEIRSFLPRLPDREKAESALAEWAGDDVGRLVQLLEKVRGKALPLVPALPAEPEPGQPSDEEPAAPVRERPATAEDPQDADPWGFNGAPPAGPPAAPQAPSPPPTPPAPQAEPYKPVAPPPEPPPPVNGDPQVERLKQHLRDHRMWLPERITITVKPKGKGEEPTQVEKTRDQQMRSLLAYADSGREAALTAVDTFWSHVPQKDVVAFLERACKRSGADLEGLLADLKAKRLSRGQAALLAEQTPAAAPPVDDDDPAVAFARYVTRIDAAGTREALDAIMADVDLDPRLGDDAKAELRARANALPMPQGPS